MRDLETVWNGAVNRYPFLSELPPFKSKWLYQAYENMFSVLGPIRTILELGMYQGGSMVLWREALRCRVIGVDLSAPPKTVRLLERYLKESRSEGEVHCFWRTNQMDAVALREIVKKHASGTLDVVVDDASHLYVPTRRSFEILFPLLRAGGVYVVEDWMAGKRPDFQSKEGPISRVIHELVDELADAVWPIETIEVHPACVLISKGMAGRPVLRQVLPERTKRGERFNPQAVGASALAVTCTNATRETIVIFGGRPLETTFGSRQFLTALVPDEVVSANGDYDVFLRQGSTESNRMRFVVEE
jgi:predicted O-methyltransferase YrrM